MLIMKFLNFKFLIKITGGDVKLSEDDYGALSSLQGVDKIYNMYYRYFDTTQRDSIGDEVIISDSLVSSKLKNFNMDWYKF